ncbi:MAG: hypothetical protein L0154_25865 [Chloroflexi bacterium]|nr:hypothetical protein [Chloroflexota bacterium]
MTFKHAPQPEDELESSQRDEAGQNLLLPSNFIRSPHDVIALQRTYGNKAVQRLLENQPPHLQRFF